MFCFCGTGEEEEEEERLSICVMDVHEFSQIFSFWGPCLVSSDCFFLLFACVCCLSLYNINRSFFDASCCVRS